MPLPYNFHRYAGFAVGAFLSSRPVRQWIDSTVDQGCTFLRKIWSGLKAGFFALKRLAGQAGETLMRTTEPVRHFVIAQVWVLYFLTCWLTLELLALVIGQRHPSWQPV